MTRILLIHGLGGEPDHFDALVGPLGARLPAADVQRPRLSDRFEEAVDTVAGWMADGPGLVVGHSMGGHAALAAARRVRAGHGLVLLAPGGVGPRPPDALVRAVWGRAALRGRDAPAWEWAMRALYADHHHPMAERRALEHRARAGTAAGHRWIERVVRQLEGVLDGWIGDAADTPGTLRLIRGSHDPLLTDRPLTDLAARHPAASFERWEGVGHMLPDEAPERLAALIVRVLGSR